MNTLPAYIRFRLRANPVSGHGIHSPFLFEFIRGYKKYRNTLPKKYPALQSMLGYLHELTKRPFIIVAGSSAGLNPNGSYNFEIVTAQNTDTLSRELVCRDPALLVLFGSVETNQNPVAFFNTCIPHHKPESVFIFEGIYRTEAMQKVWVSATTHQATTLAVDCFHFGLVFFKTGLSKQIIRVKT